VEKLIRLKGGYGQNMPYATFLCFFCRCCFCGKIDKKVGDVTKMLSSNATKYPKIPQKPTN